MQVNKCASCYYGGNLTGFGGAQYKFKKAYKKKGDKVVELDYEAGKCGGRPCIRGKRMRVKDVLELLSAGASEDEILSDYPFLEKDDIRAVLAFAAAQADHVLLKAS